MENEYLNRLNNYNKNHCWQYEIRLQKEKEDREFIKNKFNIRFFGRHWCFNSSLCSTWRFYWWFE